MGVNHRVRPQRHRLPLQIIGGAACCLGRVVILAGLRHIQAKPAQRIDHYVTMLQLAGQNAHGGDLRLALIGGAALLLRFVGALALHRFAGRPRLVARLLHLLQELEHTPSLARRRQIESTENGSPARPVRHRLCLMHDFTIHRLASSNGKPASLVALFHGYGADGRDLLDLGDNWRDMLPGTAFIAPDAPDRCEINPSGYQWWSLAEIMSGNLHMSSVAALRETGAEAMRASVTAMLDRERQALGLPWSRVALVGFSQGTMLALHVGLRLPEAPAAILGYSGMLLAPQLLHAGGLVKPPVMLVHGMMDMVVPFASLNMAEVALRSAGFDVESVTSPQLGHGIDQMGLARGGAFLKKHLG